ncbi:MAG: N-glycosylase/DNA lyase, partial [Metallosphaera sp.]
MLRRVVKDAKLRAKVLERVEEFKLNRVAGESTWYRELVLCILTANSSFFSAFYALQNLGELIFTGTEDQISETLKRSGYRFPNLKAKYIVRSRSYYGRLKNEIGKVAEKDQFEARERIMEIDGIGMKEASHFLRNVGYLDLAIIDRHVLKFFSVFFSEMKMSSKRDYLEIEAIIKAIAASFGTKPGILDVYLWYL